MSFSHNVPHNPLSLDDKDTPMAEASASSSAMSCDNEIPVACTSIEIHLLAYIPPIPQGASFANLPPFFQQMTVYLALQSEFLLPDDLAALATTSSIGKFLFQEAFYRQAKLQPLLDAASHSDKNKIKTIIKKDRSMTLFSQSGYTINPAGKSLGGNALEILIGAIDENIPRDKGISHDQCQLLLMTGTKPTKQNIPVGELRAYIFFRPTRRSNVTELYFAERMLAEHQADDVILERLDFLPDKTPFALFNALDPKFHAIYALPPQAGIRVLKPDATPNDLTLITAFTDYTHEEGLREQVERHLRTVPHGPALIEAAERKQHPPGWEREFKLQQEKNLEALKTIMSALEEASDDEVKIANEIDTQIQKILHAQVRSNCNIKNLKILIYQVHIATPNTFDKAYDELINYLQQVHVVDANDSKRSCSALPYPFNYQLLKAIFKFRNHLEPNGIIRYGNHFDHALLAEAARLYDEKYLSFGHNKDDPYAVKNQFSFQKIFGYILRGASASDAQTVAQGLYYIFDRCEKLKRTYSLFPLDSDPNWFPGYNCARAGAWRLPAGWRGRGGRFIQNFVRQKTSPVPRPKILRP